MYSIDPRLRGSVSEVEQWPIGFRFPRLQAGRFPNWSLSRWFRSKLLFFNCSCEKEQRERIPIYMLNQRFIRGMARDTCLTNQCRFRHRVLNSFNRLTVLTDGQADCNTSVLTVQIIDALTHSTVLKTREDFIIPSPITHPIAHHPSPITTSSHQI